MIKNYDQSVEINHNPTWHYTPDHPYRILIIGGSRSGKTNVLLNLIEHQRPEYQLLINRAEKYQLLINRAEKVRIEILTIPKAFCGYSQNWWCSRKIWKAIIQ